MNPKVIRNMCLLTLAILIVCCKKKETPAETDTTVSHPVQQSQPDYRDAYAGRYAVTFTCTSFYLGTSTKVYHDTITVRKAQSQEALLGVYTEFHDSTMVVDSIGFLHNGFIYTKPSFTTFRNGVGSDLSEHLDLRNGAFQYFNGRDSKSHTKVSGKKLP